MQIGNGTKVPNINVTWPHQVQIGNNCNLEPKIFFKYDGIWKKGASIVIHDNVFIGNNCEFNITDKITLRKDCLIASGCKFIDHNHSTSKALRGEREKDSKKEIILGEGVWLGVNSVILMGVEIGNNAIIAAGAVVNKSIPPNEIWGGIPAKKIGERS